MAFNSIHFFEFWILLYLLFLLFNEINSKFRNVILLIGSLFFFWKLSGFGVLLLLTVSLIDFVLAKRIHQTQNDTLKSKLLAISIVLNVSIILFFNHFADWFDFYNSTSAFHIPKFIQFASVSFYAFRSLGYVFDVYYENIEIPERNIVNYWNYASFFPIILSGPISNADSFLTRINTPKIHIPTSYISRGLFLISLGIVKKFILGNYISINFIDRVFDSYTFFTPLEVSIAAIGQTFSLYLDFSGYTDIAVGLSLLMGFEIMENFNFPFLSQNITEYWKRWHKSLSKWFNQNLYFPLSYKLRSLQKLGTLISVFIVFAVSGFWHGTAVHFWFWGILHAAALMWDVISSNWRITWRKIIPKFIYKPLSILLTFTFLTLSGIYFKAESITQGNEMVLRIFSPHDFTLFPQWINLYPWVAFSLLLVIIVQFGFSKIYIHVYALVDKTHWIVPLILFLIILFIAYQFHLMGSLPFSYLQF